MSFPIGKFTVTQSSSLSLCQGKGAAMTKSCHPSNVNMIQNIVQLLLVTIFQTLLTQFSVFLSLALISGTGP